jgi:hypothetical protein
MIFEERGRIYEGAEDTSLRKWARVVVEFLTKFPDALLIISKNNPRDGSQISGQLQLSEDGIRVCLKIGNDIRAIDQQDLSNFHLTSESVSALEEYTQKKEMESVDATVSGFDTKTSVDKLQIERERKLRELGLSRERLRAYPEAQKLLEKIKIDPITNRADYDMRNKTGRENFFREWQRRVNILPPGVPPEQLFNILYGAGQRFPAVSKDDGVVWYLENLANGLIVSNTETRPYKRVGFETHFGEPEEIFVMDWTEAWPKAQDTHGKAILQSESYSSQVLQRLGITKPGVVKISRNEIDSALWSGQPAQRIKTKAHADLIKYIGFDPNEYEFGCIRQDQYARLAQKTNFGRQNLNTHFGGYLLRENPYLYSEGLYGGNAKYGGVSYVDSNNRDNSSEDLAVRLVLGKIRKY